MSEFESPKLKMTGGILHWDWGRACNWRGGGERRNTERRRMGKKEWEEEEAIERQNTLVLFLVIFSSAMFIADL